MNAGPSELAAVNDLTVRPLAQVTDRGRIDRVTDPMHRAVAEHEMAAGRMRAAEPIAIVKSGLVLPRRPAMRTAANVVNVARVHILVVALTLPGSVEIRVDVLFADHHGATGAVADVGHLDFAA